MAKSKGFWSGIKDLIVSAYGDTKWAGASRGPELKRWLSWSGSADADNRDEVDTLRYRARDLDRNESVARGYLESTIAGVNGPAGLRYTPNPDYRLLGWTKEEADAWTQEVTYIIREALDSNDCDITRDDNAGGGAALATRRMLSDGSVLIVFDYKRDKSRKWTTCYRLIECDRISNPKGQADTDTCRGGIHIDKDGERLGFWVRRVHPGEDVLTSTADTFEWDYIPARTVWGRTQAVLLSRKDRIDQHYFPSWMSVSMPAFKMAGDYKKSEVQAAFASSIFANTFRSTASYKDVEKVFEGPGDYLSQRDRYNAKLKSGLGFGATLNLFPGDEFASHNPGRPNPNAVPFVKFVNKDIATGLNVPAEMITGDFAEMNYSSARTALLTGKRSYAVIRRIIERLFYQNLVDCLFEEGVWKGRIPRCTPTDFYKNKAAWTRAHWSGPENGYIDPLKEAQATTENIENGTSTYQYECDVQGKDWRDVIDQQAAEMKYCEERNVPWRPSLAKTAPKPNANDPTVDQPNNQKQKGT